MYANRIRRYVGLNMAICKKVIRGESTTVANVKTTWTMRFYGAETESGVPALSSVEFNNDGYEIPLAHLEIGTHEWNMVTASGNTIRLKMITNIELGISYPQNCPNCNGVGMGCKKCLGNGRISK